MKSYNPQKDRRGKPYSKVSNYECLLCKWEGYAVGTKLPKSCWKCQSKQLEWV